MTSNKIDTVTISDTSDLPFVDIRINEFDVSNVVLSCPLKQSVNYPTNSFAFPYYMISGKPHRFKIIVFAEAKRPIHDVNYAESKLDDKIDKTVRIDVDYDNDPIHRRIVDAMLNLHDRILEIISRTPTFLKAVFKEQMYKTYFMDLSSKLKADPNFDKDAFWYSHVENVYSSANFLGSKAFVMESSDIGDETIQSRKLDDNGDFVMNSRFPLFMDYVEFIDKKTGKYRASTVGKKSSSDLKHYYFDELKGNRGTLAKMTISTGMITISHSKIKIRKQVIGGYLINLTPSLTNSIDSYGADIDPSFQHITISDPQSDETSIDEDYDDDMIEV